MMKITIYYFSYFVSSKIIFLFAGQCRYRIYEQNMIQSNDVLTITAIMWQRCHDLCETVTEITCRSFEYNPGSQYCQLSDTNRWRETNQFAFNVPSWDYYHKSCVTGKTWSHVITCMQDYNRVCLLPQILLYFSLWTFK